MIAENTGRNLNSIKQDLKSKGDIGLVAQSSKYTQTTMFKSKKRLTVNKVFQTFREISEIAGSTSTLKKLNKVKEIFINNENSESRYIVRFVCGKMRIGLAQQSILVALAQAFTYASSSSKPKKSQIDENVSNLKSAFNECPSYDIIIPLILEHGIEKLPDFCKMHPGIPVKPMLAQPTKGDINDLFAKFETISPTSKTKVEGEGVNELIEPLTFEWKYDGERAQIHLCKDGSIKVYSRNQEDTTSKYPDLLERFQASLNSGPDNLEETKFGDGIDGNAIFDCGVVTDFILDSEVVAWDPTKEHILPFQILSTRKRKDACTQDITVQVCVFAFDLIYLNGSPLNHLPFHERRKKLLQNFTHQPGHFEFAQHLDVHHNEQKDIDAIAEFMESSIKGNCEGLMVKNLNSIYEIDKRSKEWLKLKKDYLDTTGDTFDLVIIGAYTGKGKRTGVYGGLLLACYDDVNEQYQTICKLGTGFKDADLEELKTKLEPFIIKQPKSYYLTADSTTGWPDVWFEPSLLCEVKAADLSISPAHKAAVGLVDENKGISLRFPRYIKLREDKKPEQATTATEVARSYNEQGQISNKNASAADGISQSKTLAENDESDDLED